MTDVIFARGQNTNLDNLAKEDGQLIFTTDTQEIYMDYKKDNNINRIKMHTSEGVGKAYNSNGGEIFNDYNYNKASGNYSTAEGSNTTASGSMSHASGYYTEAKYGNQFVCGIFNDNQKNAIFEVGNGNNPIDKSNAFAVYTDGHAEVKVMGKTDNSVATKQYVDSIQFERAGEVGQRTAEGGEIFNDYARNEASNVHSHAEGENTKASGKSSHAEGYGSQAIGYGAHAEGGNDQDPTMAIGNYSHAEGYSTHAKGDHSHSEGYYSYAEGASSHAEGSATIASGSASHTSGYYTVAAYDNQFVVGTKNNNKENTLFEVGNGSGITKQGYYLVSTNPNEFNQYNLDSCQYYIGELVAQQDFLPLDTTMALKPVTKSTLNNIVNSVADAVLYEKRLTCSNAFEVYQDGSISIGGVKITPGQLTALLNLLNQ